MIAAINYMGSITSLSTKIYGVVHVQFLKIYALAGCLNSQTPVECGDIWPKNLKLKFHLKELT